MDSTIGRSIAAIVAASLSAVACSSTTKATDPATSVDPIIKCEGVNSCKGTSECASADGKNSCQGLNECKGQGFISIPTSECTAKGGKEYVAKAAPKSDAAPAAQPDAAAPDALSIRSVKCEGINDCKGTSECASSTNGCKGLNDCKGHGWITVPETDCTSKGGKVLS